MKRVLLSSICLLGATGISADAVNNGRHEAMMRILKEWKDSSVNVVTEKKMQQLPALFEKHKNTIFAELKTALLYTRDHFEYMKSSKDALMAFSQAVKSYPAWSRSATMDAFVKDTTIAQLITSLMAMAASGDELRNAFFQKYNSPGLKEFYTDYPSSVEQTRVMGAILGNPANQIAFMQGPLLPAEAYCWSMAVKGVDITGAVGGEVIAILKDNVDVICAQLDVLHALPEKSLANEKFVQQLVVLALISSDVCVKCSKPVVDRIVSEKLFAGAEKGGEYFEKVNTAVSKAFGLVRNDEWFSNTWQKTRNVQEIIALALKPSCQDQCKGGCPGSACRASGVDVCSCSNDDAPQCACCPCAGESCSAVCVDKSPCLDENKI